MGCVKLCIAGTNRQWARPALRKEVKMKRRTLIAILGIALLGAACTDTQHYPISGEDCGPDDPVKEISVQQCARAA